MLDYRNDITAYSDRELSLQVFNDQYFYNEIENRRYFFALISEQFKYNNAQFRDLLDSINAMTK
jgi:hypothetical protein